MTLAVGRHPCLLMKLLSQPCFQEPERAVVAAVDVVCAALSSADIVIRGDSGRDIGSAKLHATTRALEYHMPPNVPPRAPMKSNCQLDWYVHKQ